MHIWHIKYLHNEQFMHLEVTHLLIYNDAFQM